MEKKLYRSRANRTISGVCGGLGEFLNIDPTIVRVLWVLLSVFSAGFPGLIVYIILAAVIPDAPEGFEGFAQPYEAPYEAPFQPPPYVAPDPPANPPESE